jgi:multidrug efflux pump subunit AcrA (membrane-fusion protein)
MRHMGISYDALMSTREPGPGRSSDVLDAILGKVSDNRTRTDTTNALFRATALDQLDVAADVDNQLPLVSRRNWLLLVGAGLIVVAFITWAALTPATQTVSGTGRVLAPSGLLAVTSPESGIVMEMSAESGGRVSAGDEVAVLATQTATAPVISFVSGTTWQVPASIGYPVAKGQIIASLLPDNSEATALIVLPDAEAEQVRPGMQVNANGSTVGTVGSVVPPLPAVDIMDRTGVSVPMGQLASIVVVNLDQPAEPGRSATYTILLTSGSVLEQFLSR